MPQTSSTVRRIARIAATADAAIRDGDTGVYSRAVFRDSLGEALARTQRGEGYLSVFMVMFEREGDAPIVVDVLRRNGFYDETMGRWGDDRLVGYREGCGYDESMDLGRVVGEGLSPRTVDGEERKRIGHGIGIVTQPTGDGARVFGLPMEELLGRLEHLSGTAYRNGRNEVLHHSDSEKEADDEC